MYVYKILIASALFISCKSDFVDNLKKCSVKDEMCQKDFHQMLWNEISEKGIPSLGISQFDPFSFQNVSIPFIGSAFQVVINGVINGLRKCNIDYFHTNADTKTDEMGLICDVTIVGHFHFKGSGEFTEKLLHKGSVEGDGDDLLTIDKLRLNVTYSKYPVIRNGEVYMHMPRDSIAYTYDAAKMTLTSQPILIGKDDFSKLVVENVNENWEHLLKTSGKQFIDPAIMIYYGNVEKLYTEISANKFIKEDLSSVAVKE